MCKYYHPELGGCCYAQKDAPKVYCKGKRCNCELYTDNNSGRYIIKKIKNNGAVIWEHKIIKDEELIFTLADIADELVDDDTVCVRITKFKLDGRTIDGKEKS